MSKFNFLAWQSPSNNFTNICWLRTSINSFKVITKFLTFCSHLFLFRKLLFRKMLIIMWQISKNRILDFIWGRLTGTVRAIWVIYWWVIVVLTRVRRGNVNWFFLIWLAIYRFLIQIFRKIFYWIKLILILLNKFYLTIYIFFNNKLFF